MVDCGYGPVMENEIDERGFAVVRQVIEASEQQELISVLGPVLGAGRRGLLGVPAVAALACSTGLLDLVRPHLPLEPLPVRAIYFDKSSEGNWLVPWHQGLTLAVRDRVNVHGFGPWSVKEGVPHVQPPVELLEQMLIVRIYLDNADETNGALRVMPGSHRLAASPLNASRSCGRENESICVRPAPATHCSCARYCSTRPVAPRVRAIEGFCTSSMRGFHFLLNCTDTNRRP
jgi:hypothetical protein